MVAIFWDYEYCHIPQGASAYAVVNNIRETAHAFGTVTLFKAYFPWSEQSPLIKPPSIRSDLQACGVSLTDCPYNGRKDVADKMILVDMLTYAMDNSPQDALVLISGNDDFSYALSTLRLRRYQLIIVAPNGAHIGLKALASVFLEWNCDILGEISRNPCDNLHDQECATASSSRRQVSHLPANHSQLPALSLSPMDTKFKERFSNKPHANTGPFSSNQPGELMGSESVVAAASEDSSTSSTGTSTLLSHGKRRDSFSIPPSAANWRRAYNLPPKIKADPSTRGNGGIALHSGFKLPAPIQVTHGTQTDDESIPYSSESVSPTVTEVPESKEYTSIPAQYVPSNVVVHRDSSGSTLGKPQILPDSSTATNVSSEKQTVPFAQPGFTSSTAEGPFSQLPTLSFGSTPKSPDADSLAGLSNTVENTRPHQCLPIVGHSLNKVGPLSGGVRLNSGLTVNASTNLFDTAATGNSVVPTQTTIENTLDTLQTRCDIPTNSSVPVNEEWARVIDFTALIEILEKERVAGNSRVLRSKVGLLLTERDEAVYKRAGVTSFRPYAALAEERGVVQLGGKDGSAWISLRTEQTGRRSVQSPLEASVAVEPRPLLTRHPPPEFTLLVELLKKEHLRGNTQVSRSTIAIALLQQDKFAYKRAGVQKFNEYSALAEKAGIAQMGGREGDAWIALHPYWRDELCPGPRI